MMLIPEYLPKNRNRDDVIHTDGWKLFKKDHPVCATIYEDLGNEVPSLLSAYKLQMIKIMKISNVRHVIQIVSI